MKFKPIHTRNHDQKRHQIVPEIIKGYKNDTRCKYCKKCIMCNFNGAVVLRYTDCFIRGAQNYDQ